MIARLIRATVSASLVVGAVLTVISVLLMPDFSGGHAERLQAIAAERGTATVSSLAFTFAQLFLAIGVVGLAHLARSRAPVLATLGGILVLLGAFGHAVYGGVRIVMLSMAADLSSLEAFAAVLQRGEKGAGLPFMLMGLLGTVLGLVLIGIALWRGRLGPRWLGPAIIGWVVLEFVGSGLSQWAGYASGLLYAVVFLTMATLTWRSSLSHWQSAAGSPAADHDRPSGLVVQSPQA